MDPNSASAVAMAALASPHQLKPLGPLNPLGPPTGISGLPPPAVDPISPVVQPGRRAPLDLDPHLHHQQQLAGYFPNPYQEPIKTIFISGLPDDVKPREIHNLFRCPTASSSASSSTPAGATRLIKQGQIAGFPHPGYNF